MAPDGAPAGGSGSAAPAPSTIESHYGEVAAQAYEAAFFYSSPEYRRWVMGHVESYFGRDEDASIVDLGGGTGNFWAERRVPGAARRRVLCVDASAEMLAKAAEQPAVEPMLADALSFAQLPPEAVAPYDRVLLKELVHHLPEADLPPMYTGLFRQLAPGGVALTITRPQEVDYPLFQHARQVWREHQPHHSVFVAAMEAAGFEVEVHSHDYVARLPKATWLGMMRSRFWSTFSHCSDEELEQGIAEVDAQYAGQEELEFVDRLLFLVARKRPAGAGSAARGTPSAAASTTSPALAQPQTSAAPWLLSDAQRQQYHADGFTGPVDVLSLEQAAAALAAFEAYEHGRGGRVEGDWRFKAHLLLPWLWELASHPRLAGVAAEALGGVRNLLLWSTDVFVKLPRDGGYTSWHQDSAYVGLSPVRDVVTVWLALTPSCPANGCLRFLPGSQHRLLRHEDTYAKGNLLLKGQTIPELEAAGEQGVALELRPGQCSLHAIQVAHCSGPATADAPRRVGIAFRFMAAHVRQELEPRDSVVVVRGVDTFGQYRQERQPEAELDAAALEEHARSVGRVYPDGWTGDRR